MPQVEDRATLFSFGSRFQNEESLKNYAMHIGVHPRLCRFTYDILMYPTFLYTEEFREKCGIFCRKGGIPDSYRKLCKLYAG